MNTTNQNLNGDDYTPEELSAANLTAYALGQLSGDDLGAFERSCSANPSEKTGREICKIKFLAAAIAATRCSEPLSPRSPELEHRIIGGLDGATTVTPRVAKNAKSKQKQSWRLSLVEWLVAGGVLAILVALFLPASQSAREASRRGQAENELRNLALAQQNFHDSYGSPPDGARTRWSTAFAGADQVKAESSYWASSAPPPGGTPGVQYHSLLGDVDDRIAVGKDSKTLEELIRRGVVPKSWDDSGSMTRSEQYAPIHENSFLSPLRQPLSTFSIDVDTASYANTRRFLNSGQLPPPDAVRIEELVNYFRYDYPQPKEDQPFSVNMETAECPWREGHLLLRVGLKGTDVEREKRPASNLVFLLDVSGSMSDENKLPLLKTAMKMLVGEFGENDRVSIVTYAGDAGLKLPSARGHEQKRINAAIDSLHSGGSTNGSAGIELAYEQATAHFIEGGTNRVILCTDGDLNVGITSDEALVELIKRKAASHVFLTVLGFGQGNLQDAKMERLADNGNGLHAYIDSVREARKVLVEQLTGSTITIAKDVKIQIEFNPAQIAAYRLLGYENRIMAAQDFNNDKKDAGEIGAGHTVTALYELVPVGVIEKPEPQLQPSVDPLKYQKTEAGGEGTGANGTVGGFGGSLTGPGGVAISASGGRKPTEANEILTLKLRYKQPTAETSQLLEYPLSDRGPSFDSASPDFQFAAAVASFGMVLRNSQHRGNSNLAAVAEVASSAIGTDAGGYRAEFLDLVRKAQSLGVK